MSNPAAVKATRDTKERILDAAEELFAEHGVEATSIRSVISLAEVNLAAIHYHFGSKEELLRAVVARRIDPLNEERIRMLDEYERGGEFTLEQVLEAFVGPMMRWSYGETRSSGIPKLIGRLLGEPGFFSKIAPEQFGKIKTRFSQALGQCLPDLSPEELFWRLMLIVGASTYVLRVADHLPSLSNGICGDVSAETATNRIVAFLAAGLRAEASGE